MRSPGCGASGVSVGSLGGVSVGDDAASGWTAVALSVAVIAEGSLGVVLSLLAGVALSVAVIAEGSLVVLSLGVVALSVAVIAEGSLEGLLAAIALSVAPPLFGLLDRSVCIIRSNWSCSIDYRSTFHIGMR